MLVVEPALSRSTVAMVTADPAVESVKAIEPPVSAAPSTDKLNASVVALPAAASSVTATLLFKEKSTLPS